MKTFTRLKMRTATVKWAGARERFFSFLRVGIDFSFGSINNVFLTFFVRGAPCEAPRVEEVDRTERYNTIIPQNV